VTGLKVTVPVACFRPGLSRDLRETYPVPPPATCYGFLLSLVGERDRSRHLGVRVTPALLNRPDRSLVLRSFWRFKVKLPQGCGNNVCPEFQELLTGVELALWVDSSGEADPAGPRLEDRVAEALDHPERVRRFGALALGESTHLVDEVRRLRPQDGGVARTYLLADRGRLSLPVWVDHVGTAGTRWVTGDLVEGPLQPPALGRMPVIAA
jgi:CRISPR-associated protein Cas5t